MGYYSDHLSGGRLRECYEIAPPRVRQYLESEIRFVLERTRPGESLLELGCGYGRVAFPLAEAGRRVTGIDTAAASIELAVTLAGSGSGCRFLVMDALHLDFPDGTFDAAICVQNGICAFGVDPDALIREVLRVARPGGRVLFSTYSERFWPQRLRWFELQAEHGLIGEIDHAATGDGVIVCRDGFRAGVMTPDRFRSLCSGTGIEPEITEVDESSLFFELAVPD